jgi:hypothetical protein
MKSGPRTDPWVGRGIFAGITLISLGWALYTQHAWEDFFITYRASKNLAMGNGLVFTVGERIQTFTSPIQALVPAAIAWLTGCRSDSLVLWIFRIPGACALGGCGVFLWRISRRAGWPAVATLACIGLFAFDAKTLDFTANGMETPYLLFFMAWQAFLVFTGGSTPWLGVAWAGMMYARPDACIQIAAFYGALLVLGREGITRGELALRAVRAGMVAAVLYAPWILWTAWYYGSPIPNTILAKGLNSPHGFADIARSIGEAPLRMIVNGDFNRFLFAPTFIELGPISDWGLPSHCLWLLLSLLPWAYWLNPWGGRWARTFSLWLFLDSIYEVCAPRYPWYLPPYALVAMIAWGFMIGDLTGRVASDAGAARLPTAGSLRKALPWVVLALLLFQLRTAGLMAETMREQQLLIEDGNRRPLGVWLHDHSAPGDTVFLECLGYIGFYSNLKMYDYPGLSSREMIAARKKLGTDDYGALIRELKPVWLVLRAGEARGLASADPGLLRGQDTSAYVLARTYDRSAQVAELGDLPGRSLLVWDQTFLVFHRRH